MDFNSCELFEEEIRSGKIAVGCVITFTDPAVTELAADSGMDFCWIDAEHGPLDRLTVQNHIIALRGTRCAPLLRVPDNDYTEIKKLIDLGPAGIIVPMVHNAEEARRAVDSCRYPPIGSRGAGFRRAVHYGAADVREYWRRSETEPLVILQLEHIEACRNLDEILAVPGIYAMLVGPYDLSASMNCPGNFDDPEFNRVLDEACAKIRRAGVVLGAYTETNYERWIRRGVQFFGTVNDTGAMFDGFRRKAAELRGALAAEKADGRNV